MKKSFAATKLGLALLVATTGCSTWKGQAGQTKNNPWSPSSWFKKEYQTPTSMAVIWSPDVLAMPGAKPTRGFGGRVYFYNERSQAIPVDGEIVVHGYGSRPGAREPSDQVAADKTFAFTQEQLKNHFSPSELGASYSIWIPWDAADGLRREVTLIPAFKSSSGQIVQGEASKVYLPGRKAEEDDLPAPMVQTVSYRASSMPTNPGYELPRTSGLRTTTIEVPPASTLNRGGANAGKLKSYLLNTAKATDGAAPTQNTPSAATASVQQMAIPSTPAMTAADFSAASEAATKADPTSLPKLNSLQLEPLKSPIAHQPWNQQTN